MSELKKLFRTVCLSKIPRGRRQRFEGGGAHVLWCLGLSLLICQLGCVSMGPKQQEASVNTVRRGDTGTPRPITFLEVQHEVMRFADEYLDKIAQVYDEIEETTDILRIRSMALRLKVAQGTAAVSIATGPSPMVNLLDMVVLTSLSNNAIQQHHQKVMGEAGRRLKSVYQSLEDDVWVIANKLLSDAQQAELRQLIDEWVNRHPDQSYVSFVRMGDFAESISQSQLATKRRSGSILGLLFLDPLAKLDPTTKEIEQTRHLAERTIFYLQRMPRILEWHMESLADDLVQTPQIRDILSDSERFVQAFEAISKTIQGLPSQLDQTLAGTVAQALQGIAAEREAFQSFLFDEKERLQELVAKIEESFLAGDEMATSVDGAVQSLDEFMSRFDSKDPNPDPNKKPFDINEWSVAFRETAMAAAELNRVLESIDQQMPKLDGFTGSINANAATLMRLGFFYGVGLIAIFCAGLLVVRFLSHRWFTTPSQ